MNKNREQHGEVSPGKKEFNIHAKHQVTLTHGLLGLSDTIGLMGSTMDNQNHLAIKPNNTNKYRQTLQKL